MGKIGGGFVFYISDKICFNHINVDSWNIQITSFELLFVIIFSPKSFDISLGYGATRSLC